MLRSSCHALVLGLALAACTSRTTVEPSPAGDGPVNGWFLSGPRLQGFRIGVDRAVRVAGSSSGRLESVESGPGAGTMMQSISADAYRGKRLRFSAAVRTRDVDGWTGLWMRVDRPDGRSTFDNMQLRPLRGSVEWTRAAVVLDVAQDATAIHFGLLQDGNGTSWIDEAALETVGSDVPVTALDPYPRALVNADLDGAVERDGLPPQPAGWAVRGWAADDFRAVVDRVEKHGGTSSAKLTNGVDEPRGHAGLTQIIRADDHAGTRVRVSAWVKGKDVERPGSFVVTSYAADSGPMSPGLTHATCALTGTFDWRLCENVLDVPSIADTLEVSLSLESKGTVWIDDVRVTPVGLDVPLTEVDDRPRSLVDGAFESGATMQGWYLSGGARAHFQATLDSRERHGGKRSARLEPRVKAPGGYGTLMQTFRAHDLRGQRVRMTAHVKGKDIDGRGDVWTRVQAADSPGDGGGLGGGICKLSGTFDWRPCTIVVDVPERGDSVDVGVGLGAHGSVWIDDVTFEVVDKSVPLTARGESRHELEDGGFEGATTIPDGWFMSGASAKDYEVAVDGVEHRGGAKSVRLAARAEKPTGYGTLMTSIIADAYRGKRLRMTAQVRGRGVAGRGDMWLRVQSAISPGDGPGLGGGSCALAGDFDWRPCSVVFDVPERAARIEIGMGLAGPGAVWLDDVAVEEVEQTAKITSVVHEKLAPENLGFER